MKITTILSTITLAALAISCSNASAKGESKDEAASDNNTSLVEELPTGATLSIEGMMTGGTGNTTYLFSFAGKEPLKLDSSIISENGRFVLGTVQNGYEIMGVGFSPIEAIPLIVNTSEKIKITGTKDTWTKETIVSGSKNSEAMINYNKRRLKFSVDMQALRDIYNTLDQNDAVAMADINTKGMALQTEFTEFKNQYINTNINQPAIAAAIPDITNIVEDLERFTAMEATISKYFPDTEFSKSVSKMLQQSLDFKANKGQQQQQKPTGLPIGSAAPDLNFASPSGKKIKLSSLKGKVVLLDFWASWCGPCRKENPNVVNVYNQYKDKGFTVYSVSLDNNEAKWLAAIEKDGLVWPNHVSDLKGWQSDAAAIYGISSIPMTYLIDTDGIIVASHLRGNQLETKLKEILK